MRYLRDTGLDAHLFLWDNELNDFTPEKDTWYIEQWHAYIHQTNLTNGNLWKYFTTRNKDIKKIFKDFNFIIGTGFAPALFYKSGLTLDLMYPYSGGIEFIRYKKPIEGDTILSKIRFLFTDIIYRYLQSKGIKHNTKNIWLFDAFSEEYCIKNNINYNYCALPLLYVEPVSNISIPENLESYVSLMKQSDLVVFSHVAHNYITVFTAKKNDVLIKGFAKFSKNQSKFKKPLLVLLDKGADVEYSKQLIRELNIESQVLWIPLLQRKEIMLLLQYAQIGGSEFYGYLWGGTGWEFMASGLPILHNTGLSKEQFEEKLGIPYPPIYECKTDDDVARHLMHFDVHEGKRVGKALQNWFNDNNGKALADKYVALIKNA